MSATVALRDGAVYLPAALAERFFAGIDAVILLVRDGRLLILPVRGAEAGGCLLKILNRAGDRVARAPDALAAAGIGALSAEGLPAVWDAGQHGLSIALPGSAQEGFGQAKEDRQKNDKMIY